MGAVGAFGAQKSIKHPSDLSSPHRPINCPWRIILNFFGCVAACCYSNLYLNGSIHQRHGVLFESLHLLRLAMHMLLDDVVEIHCLQSEAASPCQPVTPTTPGTAPPMWEA